MVVAVSHFYPSLIIADKASSLHFKWNIATALIGWAPTLTANSKLGWKYLTVTNVLAY
jgi:hypothetical protein